MSISELLLRVAQISPQGVNLPNQVAPTEDGAFITNTLQGVLQLAFGILGAISVLVIVVAALQYVLSAGDSQKVARAKDAIIYAVVGLVIALLSYGIVTWVLDGVLQ